MKGKCLRSFFTNCDLENILQLVGRNGLAEVYTFLLFSGQNGLFPDKSVKGNSTSPKKATYLKSNCSEFQCMEATFLLK